MIHGRFVLEDAWKTRKEAISPAVTWEAAIKKGIEAFEEGKNCDSDSQNCEKTVVNETVN